MSQLQLNQYDVKSLGAAIYAICSWPDNRNYLSIVDQLNRDFIDYENLGKYGRQQINTFQDFVRFYSLVKDKYSKKALPPERFAVDIGQVRFFSDDTHKYFSIFVGTGSENIYESCYITDQLVKNHVQAASIWHAILKYEDCVMKTIYAEMSADDKEGKAFSCPDNDYFYRVKKSYLDFKSETLAKFFYGYQSVNVELYPFFTKQLQLPVFLPTMKEVFEELVEPRFTSENICRATNNALQERVISNFANNVSDHTYLLIKANIYNENKKLCFKNTIALFDENTCIVIIAVRDTDSAKKVIATQLENHDVDIEGKSGKQVETRVAINRTTKVTYQLVAIDEISPNQTMIGFQDALKTILPTSKDMIGIFNSASSIEEVIEFVNAYLQISSTGAEQM